ncbi:MAG: hypothetical protein IPK61_01515 [Saprospiraceae bacterium]|nr:hypothetical protein [Saprospiraceae bacterium]
MLASTYLGNEAERFDIKSYYRLAEIEIGNTSLTEAKEVSLWGRRYTTQLQQKLFRIHSLFG